MQVTIELPAQVSISLPKKSGGGTADIDMTKIYANPSAVAACLIFALKQKAANTVAPAEIQAEEAKKRVAAMVARFNEGDVAEEGTRTADPVEREAWRLASEMVKAYILSKGRKVKEFTSEQLDAARTGLLEGKDGPAIYETARKNVASRAVPAAPTDLSALGL